MAKSAVLVSIKLSDLVEHFPQKAQVKVSKRWLEDLGFDLQDLSSEKEKLQVNEKNLLTNHEPQDTVEASATPKPFGAFGDID